SVRSALDNRELAHINAPEGASGAPAVLSQRGKLAAVTYPRGGVYVWDISRSAWSFSVPGVWAALSPDNKTLAVAAPGGGVAVYDLATSNKLRTIGLPAQFTWLSFEPTGQKLAALTAGQTAQEIQVLDIATGEGLAHLSVPAKLWFLAWHPDGR